MKITADESNIIFKIHNNQQYVKQIHLVHEPSPSLDWFGACI